ncbi:MAG: YIP1 family protein [Candidatus Micrarchaeia archaeon]|jgi:peptidoglycan/LPS O-acetylase OafA/YrhL
MEKASAKAKSSSVFPINGKPLATGIVSAIPASPFKTWVAAYFWPSQTFDAQKSSISPNRLGIELVAMSLIPVILAFLTMMVASPSQNVIIAFAVLLGIVAVSFLVAFAIVAGALYIVAKMLGGKGAFFEHAYAIAMILGGAFVLAVPFELLRMVPFMGAIAGLAILLLALYNVYNFSVMMQHVHRISRAKTYVLIVVALLLAGGLMVAAGTV